MSADTLPVHETFHTFQGEGFHLGRSAFFIRLFGCPVHCPWCDSAGTWHPDHIPDRIDRICIDKLVTMARAAKPDIVVITGGEPAIHELSRLAQGLREQHLPVHLETSGGFALKGTFDWVTLSPKRWKEPLEATVAQADEFKLIVDSPDAITHWNDCLGLQQQSKPVWLHPEWSLHRDAPTLQRIADWVRSHGAPFRAGWQLHKNYGVD